MSTQSGPAWGILDTSAFIALEHLAPDDLPEEAVITAITLAELSSGPLVATDDGERARRQRHVQFAESSFASLPFDDEAARAFGTVSASLRRAGRKSGARAYDALIAAIALARGLPVYTCNPRDFEGIDGLAVVAVSPGGGRPPHPGDDRP